jgi:hypothetical protein
MFHSCRALGSTHGTRSKVMISPVRHLTTGPIGPKGYPHSYLNWWYEWTTDKGRRRIELPHYCLTRIDDIKRNLQRYAKEVWDIYLAELSESHPIASLTINMAVHYMKFQSLRATITTT